MSTSVHFVLIVESLKLHDTYAVDLRDKLVFQLQILTSINLISKFCVVDAIVIETNTNVEQSLHTK